MPAKSKAQLKAAYAAKAKGKSWGAKMVAHTPRKMRSKMMKGK